MPVSYASWSTTTIQSSASAGNAPCWVYPDPRSATGRHRCGNRRCKSWPGSILSTWRIPAAAAAGWWTTWPKKGFRSAAIGCETSCDARVYGGSFRSHDHSLVAIVDLFSRNVLSWKLSNSLDTEFCLDALEMALEGGRRPEIFHSDQGCQLTSSDFVAKLQAEKIKISLSDRKRCYDNILVERLWRTVKVLGGVSACLQR